MADPTKEELEMMMRMILGKKYNPDFDPRTLGKREDAAVGPSPDWNPKDTDARKYKKLFEDERVEKILFEALKPKDKARLYHLLKEHDDEKARQVHPDWDPSDTAMRNIFGRPSALGFAMQREQRIAKEEKRKKEQEMLREALRGLIKNQ